jgi:DNA polymerase-4
MSTRTIVHLDLDTFFVSVERLKNSAFNGKPLIIGGLSDRGVVASCSYETRAFGVHSAMPTKMAKYLCPDAIFLKGDMDSYSKYSNDVTEIIAANSPAFEKASIDEHYIDITGMDKYYGSMKWAHELIQTIEKETHLPISFGLSVNKTVSKVATGEAKPHGEREVPAGMEKLFLAPLSIRKIPMIGEKTYHLLRNMGIDKVKTLQEMPIELMQKVFGENGITMWKKANGIDNDPVEPYSEQKSISKENTFDKDTIDTDKLHRVIAKMVEQLAYQLRSSNKLTSCLTIKIRYSDFNTCTQQVKIPYTSADHILIPRAKEIFDKLFAKRLLVRLIGVKFSGLVGGNQQINLFEDTTEMYNLYQAMDKVRRRFGEDKIGRCIQL